MNPFTEKFQETYKHHRLKAAEHELKERLWRKLTRMTVKELLELAGSLGIKFSKEMQELETANRTSNETVNRHPNL